MAALIKGTTCLPSPLNERATNEHPSVSATAHGSIGWNVLTAPFFWTEPRSAVAENWPLVSPYVPLSSMMYVQSMLRLIMCMN
jgi:hypothetical protein